MKALLVIAFAAFVASANAKAASVLEKHPIGWYECGGQKDGNYEHPTDCNRFISCSGGIASERDCPICHVNVQNCPDGLLVYNSTVDQCLWADETSCGGNGGGNPPTTSEQPITPPPTNQPTTGATPPSNDTTTGATDATTTANPGEDCDPEECVTTGWCQHYKRCDKVSKKWVESKCGKNLVWNPHNKDGSNHTHGGNCDHFKNLQPHIAREYRTNETCLACFWKEKGECRRDYEYQAPHLTERTVETLWCDVDLVFVKDRETCERCQDVIDKTTGAPCCNLPKD